MARYFLIISCFLSVSLYGQRQNMGVKLLHYVLDSFSTGRVHIKSGKLYEQILNYNILTNEWIFDNSGRLLAIANPSEVDTITIQDRKFVPGNNKFYELLTGTTTPLLLEFTYKMDDPGISVGYGNASATTNATSYSSLVSTGAVYDIKLPDDFKVIPGYAYWIKKDGKYLKAGTAKQLIDIFPDRKDAIKTFVKKNNTNFSKSEDIIRLVQEIQ